MIQLRLRDDRGRALEGNTLIFAYESVAGDVASTNGSRPGKSPATGVWCSTARGGSREDCVKVSAWYRAQNVWIAVRDAPSPGSPSSVKQIQRGPRHREPGSARAPSLRSAAVGGARRRGVARPASVVWKALERTVGPTRNNEYLRYAESLRRPEQL